VVGHEYKEEDETRHVGHARPRGPAIDLLVVPLKVVVPVLFKLGVLPLNPPLLLLFQLGLFLLKHDFICSLSFVCFP
jgi:hypothetical protein